MNVSHNLLATISLRNLPELEVLDVSGNQLNEVPADVTGAVLPALRWLSLDHNPIRQVSFPKPSGGADAEEREGERFLYLTFVSISHMDELTELDAGAFAGTVLIICMGLRCRNETADFSKMKSVDSSIL